jgi:hypothetical protein
VEEDGAALLVKSTISLNSLAIMQTVHFIIFTPIYECCACRLDDPVIEQAGAVPSNPNLENPKIPGALLQLIAA